MDDSGVLTWCWKDSVCVSLATAAIAAILAVARRLDSPDQTPRRRRNFAASCVHLATGGTIGGGTSFGLCLLGVSLWPTQGKVVSAVVILLAVSIDWTADTGRKFLLRLAEIGRASCRERV